MAEASERLVTVIIPTVDRPRLLERAIGSALTQEGVRFEVLVVDDGGGAGIDYVEALGRSDVRAISSERQGQVPARRLGVREARGALIAFLDDDDWWAAPDHLARLMAVMPDEPALAYASGIVVVEDEALNPVEEMPFRSFATAATLASDNTLIVSALLFARQLIDMHGEFDAAFPYYWDWDWYLRLARAGVPLVASNGDAVRVSARAGSVSSAANLAARRADLDRLSEKHGLGHIPLRNHESIARDRQAGGA